MLEGAKAQLAQTGTEDGAILTLPDGREIGVYFARTGKVGGRIVTDEKTIPLTDKVMEQNGIGIETAE